MDSARRLLLLRLCLALGLWGVTGKGDTGNCTWGCPENSRCVNATHCTCLPGFQSVSGALYFYSSSDSCDDVNECAAPGQEKCGANGQCNNFAGGFNCTCFSGFEARPSKESFTNASGNTCQDIDECQENVSACAPHGNCINTPGEFMCMCKAGFAKRNKGKAKICIDLDECYRSPAICGPRTRCYNTIGSYRCVCAPGHIPSTGFGTWVYHKTMCKEVPTVNCSTTFEAVTEMCRNFSLQEADRSFSSLQNISAQPGRSDEEVMLAVTLLLENVERAALATALRSPEVTQTIVMESMALETRRITGTCSQDSEVFVLRAREQAMEVHCSTVSDAASQAASEGSGAAVFISYSTLNSIVNNPIFQKTSVPAGQALGKVQLLSWMASGVIGPRKPNHQLLRPVKITLLHTQPKAEAKEAFCAHWKFLAGKGVWAWDGCSTLHTNSTHTACNCSHLSTFALLMASAPVEESDALSVLTYVGLSISMLCLVLAILTFLLCRSLWNVSTAIHLQLCLCLFLADLLFLTTVTHTKNRTTCAVIAGFLHYLFLAAFTWMFLEGLHLILTVRNLKVVNYTSASRFKKRYMYPFGYGLPALVVAISAAANPGGYGTEHHCWLSLDRGFFWSFLGPVCLIILINLTCFILTLWILRSHLSSLNVDVSTLRDHRLLTFKAITQVFILGCTWSLGLFQVGSAGRVMAYLFTITNSLQGAFIFLVHCILNRQVREWYRRWMKGLWTSASKSQTSGLEISTIPVSTKSE